MSLIRKKGLEEERYPQLGQRAFLQDGDDESERLDPIARQKIAKECFDCDEAEHAGSRLESVSGTIGDLSR